MPRQQPAWAIALGDGRKPDGGCVGDGAGCYSSNHAVWRGGDWQICREGALIGDVSLQSSRLVQGLVSICLQGNTTWKLAQPLLEVFFPAMSSKAMLLRLSEPENRILGKHLWLLWMVVVQNYLYVQPKMSGKALSGFVSSQPVFFACLGMLAHLFITIISRTIS